MVIEADGEIFHTAPKQMAHDKERDHSLGQVGWTIIRFKDSEIDDQIQQVMSTVLQTIMKKEMNIKGAESVMEENKGREVKPQNMPS